MSCMVCVPETWDHTPDSTQENCEECGGIVWVSASAMKLAQENDLTFICLYCAEMDDNAIFLSPTPEQIEAVEREIFRRSKLN